MGEKRYVHGLEVLSAMHVGERETLLLYDPKSGEMPYLVACCEELGGLGYEHLSETVGGADYLEAVEVFLRRVQGQVERVRSERELTREPQEVFGAAHCLPGSLNHSLLDRVVVLKPEVLRHEYRNVANQILLVSGGFGSDPNSRGTAIFADTVFTGERHNCRRHQLLGALDPAQAPEWVAPRVERLLQPKKSKEKGAKPHELS